MNNNRKIKTLLLAAALGLGSAGLNNVAVDAAPANSVYCNTQSNVKFCNEDTLIKVGTEGKAEYTAKKDVYFKGQRHDFKKVVFSEVVEEGRDALLTITDGENAQVPTKSFESTKRNAKINYLAGDTAGVTKIKAVAEYTRGESTQHVETEFTVNVVNHVFDFDSKININKNIRIKEDQTINNLENAKFTVTIPMEDTEIENRDKISVIDEFKDDFIENIKLTLVDAHKEDANAPRMNKHIEDFFVNVNEEDTSFYDNAEVKLVRKGNYGNTYNAIEVTFNAMAQEVTNRDGINVFAAYFGQHGENKIEEYSKGNANVVIKQNKKFIKDVNVLGNFEFHGYVGERQSRIVEIKHDSLEKMNDKQKEVFRNKILQSFEVTQENYYGGFEFEFANLEKHNLNESNRKTYIEVTMVGKNRTDLVDIHGFNVNNVEFGRNNVAKFDAMFNVYKLNIVTQDEIELTVKDGKPAVRDLKLAIDYGMLDKGYGLTYSIENDKIAKVAQKDLPKLVNVGQDNIKVTALKAGTTYLNLKLEDIRTSAMEGEEEEFSNDKLNVRDVFEKRVKIVVKEEKTQSKPSTPAKPENKCAVIKRNAQGNVTYVKQCYRNGNVERETFYYYKKDGKTLVKTVNKEYAFKTNKRLVKQTVYENYKGGKWTKRTITHKHDNKANRAYSTRVLNKHANGRTKNLTYKIFHKNGKLRQHKYDAYNNKGQKTKHFNKQYFATGVLRHDHQYYNFVNGKHTKRVFKRFNERKVILSKEVATFKNGKFTKKTTYRYNKKGQLKSGKNLRAWRTITTYRKGKAHRTVRHDYTRSGKLVRS